MQWTGDNPIIKDNGDRLWFNENNYLHREDGPAIEYPNGAKQWFINGKRHRLDGPAVESLFVKEWYYYGKWLDVSSQKEFERLINLKLFW